MGIVYYSVQNISVDRHECPHFRCAGDTRASSHFSTINVRLAHTPKSQYNLALFITDRTALAGTLSLQNCDRTISIRNNDRFLSQFRRFKVLST